jgi:hypothetical protein
MLARAAARSPLYTCYLPGDRTLETFAAFVLPGLDGTVLARDRYQNYDACPGLVHQLCTAHLLRDLADAAELKHRALLEMRSGWPSLSSDVAPACSAESFCTMATLADLTKSSSARPATSAPQPPPASCPRRLPVHVASASHEEDGPLWF